MRSDLEQCDHPGGCYRPALYGRIDTYTGMRDFKPCTFVRIRLFCALHSDGKRNLFSVRDK